VGRIVIGLLLVVVHPKLSCVLSSMELAGANQIIAAFATSTTVDAF